jgi:hypothetical protein
VVQDLVRYATAHPEVDYLHFWLADGGNHCCECADCRQARPADFYVQMLNEADQLLTERRLPTRIAFLIYMDLLWPPARERIKNPDRFLMMFAPLNRSYYEPFNPAGLREPVPPFVLNQLAFPASQNLNFLAAWRDIFPGDSFIYDYRFMWGQYDDPGYMELARAAALDAPSLGAVGLNGLISDQTQRAFLPSGLPMTVLARSLWQGRISYDELADEYFAAAFGADGRAGCEYLKRLSTAFNPRWLSTYLPRKDAKAPPSTVAELEKIPQIITGFRPVMERNSSVSNECHAASWNGLAFHADLCLLMAEAIKAEVQGRPQVAGVNWRKVEELVVTRESEMHSTFDVFLFLTSMKQKHLFFRPQPAKAP